MEKKKTVIEFFELFIKKYLVGDILVLDRIKGEEANACTIPQAMAVLSGIDLLGYLLGEDKNTNNTINHFIEFYRIADTSIITDHYTKKTIQKLELYRHGMMHHFFPNFRKNIVGICKNESQELFIQEPVNNIEVESLNVSVLTMDFLLAVSVMEKLINESADDVFFDNILNALPKIEISNTLVPTTSKVLEEALIRKYGRLWYNKLVKLLY